jgi:hypothetical protein
MTLALFRLPSVTPDEVTLTLAVYPAIGVSERPL